MNTTDAEDGSFENTGGHSVGSFGYGLALSLGVLFVFLILTYVSYACKHKQTNSSNNNNSISTGNRLRRYADTADEGSILHRNGLDESAIEALFPKFEYSRAKPVASGCSICLTDYKDGDSLRSLLPDCGHVFHAKCLDPWLSMNRTCPMCRSSVVGLPPAVAGAGAGDSSVVVNVC